MEQLIRFILEKPGRILIGLFLLVALAFGATGFLRFDQDIMALMPRGNHDFQMLTHIMEQTDDQKTVYLLLQAKQGSTGEWADRIAGELRSRKLNDRPMFYRVASRKSEMFEPGTLDRVLDHFFEHPALYLTQREAENAARELSSPEKGEAELSRSMAMLAVPGQGDHTSLIAKDLLNLRRFVLPKISRFHGRSELSRDSHLLFARGETALLMAKPDADPMNISEGSAVLRALEEVEQNHPQIELAYTGGFAMAAEQRALMQNDLATSILFSALGIGLLFLLAYRSGRVLLFIFVPLGVGLQLTLGILALFWGRVHMLVVAFSAVIIGLGIDFAIHIYDRYMAERLSTRNPETALRISIMSTGRAVAAGGLTSIVCFGSLTLVDNLVLNQLGWLILLGLFFCLLTMLFTLPAWLILLERRKKTTKVRSFRKLGMSRLASFVHKNPGKALFIGLLVFSTTLPGLSRVSFESELSALEFDGLESTRGRHALQDLLGRGENFFATWTAEDPKTFWNVGGTVQERLDGMEENGRISEGTSLGLFSSGRLRAVEIDQDVVRESMASHGMDPDDFPHLQRFMERLEQGTTEWVGCETLDTGPDFLSRYFRCSGDEFQGIAWVRSGEAGPEYVRESLEDLPEVAVLSPESALEGMVSSTGSNLRSSSALAAVLVILVLAVFFRRPHRLVLALVPCILGIATCIGLFGLLGIKINLFNFIVIPVLIGIGLDDGILITFRHKEEGNLQQVLSSTGRSILLTSLTTCIGFGSLAFAHYHVLTNMGLMTIVGIAACFFHTVFVLSPILRLMETGRAPAPITAAGGEHA